MAARSAIPPFVACDPGPSWVALPLPALIIDAQGRIAAMNDLAQPFLNISTRSGLGQMLEGPAMQARLRMVPRLQPLIARARDSQDALTHSPIRFELGDRAGGFLTRHGSIHIGPAAGAVMGAMMVVITPTDGATRLGQGGAVRQAARAAIGMAEMLAHEIKNPLAGIRGAAQLLAMGLSAQDRPLADLIVEESRRIVSLLDQVEQFGDTTAPRLAPVNVHDVLERTRQSAALGFAQGVRIVTDYDPSLPPALADRDQLMQVCINLVRNAAEAILRAGSPKGTIRLRSFYDAALRVAEGSGRPGGRALPLQIEIQDNGPGIPPAIADAVFDPFVSGQENGTGLGLALVSKIVTDHGAWLALDSQPGRTVFRISLAVA